MIEMRKNDAKTALREGRDTMQGWQITIANTVPGDLTITTPDGTSHVLKEGESVNLNYGTTFTAEREE